MLGWDQGRHLTFGPEMIAPTQILTLQNWMVQATVILSDFGSDAGSGPVSTLMGEV